MLNFYAGNQFIIGLINLIFPIFFLIVEFVLLSLIIKKRSTIAGIMFFLFLSGIMQFLIMVDNGKLFLNLNKFLPDVGLGSSLCVSMELISYPTRIIHDLFIDLIIDMNLHEDVIEFFSNEYYILILYSFIFLLAFVLFKRHKKEKRIYSDYDS